jgi:phosphomevalonate kinase
VRVVAPGKLLLAGAYAVLEGAPAIVIAVDRYVVADTKQRALSVSREVRAAIGAGKAPWVDARALYDGDSKLGLGSSAAVLVASLGARAVARGNDVLGADVRDGIFRLARRAHAEVQVGGSGIDVAASVYGGALEYALRVPEPCIKPIALPEGLYVDAVWSGTSARTTELRIRVESLRERDSALFHTRINALADAAKDALASLSDVTAFVEASRATGAALAALGRDADAPIVPPAFDELAALAEAEEGGAAFFPSGAGGGDVGVYIGNRAPSETFISRLKELGMRPLTVGIDRGGVRPAT